MCVLDFLTFSGGSAALLGRGRTIHYHHRMGNFEAPLPSFVRKNERREIRHAVKWECEVVRERDFRRVAKSTLDVSPDGMLVPIDVDLVPGESVIVSFCAPRLGIWFDTEATVTRVLRGRRRFEHVAAALRFSTLDRVKRFILRSHLRRVPPPLPRRVQRIDWAKTIVRMAS